MPLRKAFVTSHGVEATKEATIVEFVGDGVSGWGECVALAEPDYTSEYADGAFEMLLRFLVPKWLHGGPTAPDGVVGHQMAKASLEFAAVDLTLRQQGRSLAEALGVIRTRVPAGVVVGLGEPVSTGDEVAWRIGEGYSRVKLKVSGSLDIEILTSMVAAFPNVVFAIDANGSLAGWDGLLDTRITDLDNLGLQFIEQPLATFDLDGHASLAERLQTPICLDEPLGSFVDVQRAVSMGACQVVNLKPGRVGGLAETLSIHDWCRSNQVGLWMGGMLETGIGRAMNLAIAALDGFTLTGDLSSSNRFFDADLTEPLTLAEGDLRVPTGPGSGVDVDRDVLRRFTTACLGFSGPSR